MGVCRSCGLSVSDGAMLFCEYGLVCNRCYHAKKSYETQQRNHAAQLDEQRRQTEALERLYEEQQSRQWREDERRRKEEQRQREFLYAEAVLKLPDRWERRITKAMSKPRATRTQVFQDRVLPYLADDIERLFAIPENTLLPFGPPFQPTPSRESEVADIVQWEQNNWQILRAHAPHSAEKVYARLRELSHTAIEHAYEKMVSHNVANHIVAVVLFPFRHMSLRTLLEAIESLGEGGDKRFSWLHGVNSEAKSCPPDKIWWLGELLQWEHEFERACRVEKFREWATRWEARIQEAERSKDSLAIACVIEHWEESCRKSEAVFTEEDLAEEQDKNLLERLRCRMGESSCEQGAKEWGHFKEVLARLSHLQHTGCDVEKAFPLRDPIPAEEHKFQPPQQEELWCMRTAKRDMSEAEGQMKLGGFLILVCIIIAQYGSFFSYGPTWSTVISAAAFFFAGCWCIWRGLSSRVKLSPVLEAAQVKQAKADEVATAKAKLEWQQAVAAQELQRDALNEEIKVYNESVWEQRKKAEAAYINDVSGLESEITNIVEAHPLLKQFITPEEAIGILKAGEEYLLLNPQNDKVNSLVKQSKIIAAPLLGERVLSLPPLHNSIGSELKLLPAGTFTMGQAEGDSDETPHEVTLTHPFYIGVYEVTNAQWKRVMGSVPSNWKDDDRPVEQVSWDDAVEFCKKLSALPEERKASRVYRLPTEAEWEYACRAGTETKYSFGDDGSRLHEYGWFSGNSTSQTHPVGRKLPNPWGLYDMHGNVWEWCNDWFGAYPNGAVMDPQGPSAASVRVVRGGSWNITARSCRSASRIGGAPSYRYDCLGFRLALSPSGVEPPEAEK